MTLADYLVLFPGASREKPRFMALAEAVLRQAADLQPVVGQLQSAFSLDTAEGVQLDVLGASFGLSRADTADGAAATDEAFRRYIRDKIRLWQWDGTNGGAAAVLAASLPGSVQADNQDGTVTAIPAGTLPAEAEVLFPVPAGIRAIKEGGRT